MKKILSVSILLLFFTAVSLSAWEPDDLTKYPSCTTPGDFTLNFGVGLSTSPIIKDYIYIPPVRFTGDINVPIGDNQLPFFAGGIIGYAGEGYSDVWYYHKITVGGRFGYHFNWAVDNLDTYAVTSAGWTIYAGDVSYINNQVGAFFWGINLGARYWVAPAFGFWAEAGFTPLSWLDIGLAFKF